MLRINRFFALLLLAALLASVCQPITRLPVTEPQLPQGIRPDAPPYAVHGPYAVGVRDFVIEGTSEYTRPLTVSVWYPALNPSGVPEEITYKMDITAGGEFPPMPTYGHAIQDAKPAPQGAPFPLVIFSHGGYMFRQSSAYLVEHLASQGFAVIAPDHVDNWGTLFQPTEAARFTGRSSCAAPWTTLRN